MTGRLAIGIGCRKDCPAAAIGDLVREARRRVSSWPQPIPPDRATLPRLFTVFDKGAEPGLCQAAADLGLDLVVLPRAALRAVMDRIATPSAAAMAALGLASVSEAAALAGAGPGGRLVLARIAANGATCAIAEEAS